MWGSNCCSDFYRPRSLFVRSSDTQPIRIFGAYRPANRTLFPHVKRGNIAGKEYNSTRRLIRYQCMLSPHAGTNGKGEISSNWLEVLRSSPNRIMTIKDKIISLTQNSTSGLLLPPRKRWNGSGAARCETWIPRLFETLCRRLFINFYAMTSKKKGLMKVRDE